MLGSCLKLDTEAHRWFFWFFGFCNVAEFTLVLFQVVLKGADHPFKVTWANYDTNSQRANWRENVEEIQAELLL